MGDWFRFQVRSPSLSIQTSLRSIFIAASQCRGDGKNNQDTIVLFTETQKMTMFKKKCYVFMNRQISSLVLGARIVITCREEGSSDRRWGKRDSHGVLLMFQSLIRVEVTWMYLLSGNLFSCIIMIYITFYMNYVFINRLDINLNWKQKRL